MRIGKLFIDVLKASWFKMAWRSYVQRVMENLKCRAIYLGRFHCKKENPFLKKMQVVGTSCRMVSFATFEKELKENNFIILEKGITNVPLEFDSFMYVVVRKSE